jgi:hypothetical protein
MGANQQVFGSSSAAAHTTFLKYINREDEEKAS